MSDLDKQYETCEACGVSAEMGFIIKEDDDVATVTITAETIDAAKHELDNYLALAKAVNENFKFEASDLIEGKLEARVQFECSAEKLIFELRSRSLVRA